MKGVGEVCIFLQLLSIQKPQVICFLTYREGGLFEEFFIYLLTYLLTETCKKERIT